MECLARRGECSVDVASNKYTTQVFAPTPLCGPRSNLHFSLRLFSHTWTGSISNFADLSCTSLHSAITIMPAWDPQGCAQEERGATAASDCTLPRAATIGDVNKATRADWKHLELARPSIGEYASRHCKSISDRYAAAAPHVDTLTAEPRPQVWS
jgi:hypothetical protein